jgi:thioredoxin-dependent peroxiredoxin
MDTRLLLGLCIPCIVKAMTALPQVQDSYGRTIDLAQLAKQGKYILLWFYPKASSPGCSMQAKRYADLYSTFKAAGVEVFGVSADPGAAQCTFIEKMALQGGMLPDKSGTLGKAFGVTGLLGIGLWFGMYNRDTVLINPEGKVEHIWRGVNPMKDADTVLEFIKAKQSLTKPA